LCSAILLIVILIRSHVGERSAALPMGYALAVNPPARVPLALNSLGLWNAILAVLMIVTYAYPIAQFFVLKRHSVPAVEVTSGINVMGVRQ